MEVDVQHLLGNRMMLDLLDERQLAGCTAGDFEIYQQVLAHGVRKQRVDIALAHLKDRGRFVVTVDDSRDKTLALDFFDR